MIIKRTHVKHEKTFKERLAEEAAHFTELAGQTPPGMQRELYLRRAQQAATASNINDWLSSPGLQPPKELKAGTQIQQGALHDYRGSSALAKLNRPWSEEDDSRLLEMTANQRKRYRIAVVLERTEVAVVARLQVLRGRKKTKRSDANSD